MSFEDAVDKALEDFGKLSPFVAASKSGTDFKNGKFVVKFFNRTFLISHPDGEVEEVGGEEGYPKWLRVLLMHYLSQADGTAVADKWIAYRQLPGGNFFEQRFLNMSINPLTKAFGDDIEGFKRGCLALGGEPITRTGDAGFRFRALPKIPMACILYLGDEEVQPAVNVLLDAASFAYLPTEDLSLLGAHLNSMQRYRTQK
ncbi:MAG: DUF3786 domain-containing protein [Chloroflexi bacterium]|jgi:hypothetical protein|nr:DUF3786 domain-containing protein [Chloroflexota bacterium]